MKQVFILVAVLLMFAASAAYAADAGQKFQQNKEKHLKNLDANIMKDMDLKACVEKAMSPAFC